MTDFPPITKQLLQKLMQEYETTKKRDILNTFCKVICPRVTTAASEGKATISFLLDDNVLKYIDDLKEKLKKIFPDCLLDYQLSNKILYISWAEEP